MFKVGQLVRSDASGLVGVVIQANKNTFTVSVESLQDRGIVCNPLPQDDKATSLIGNNYRSKK